MITKQTEVWIAIYAAEYTRLRALAGLDIYAVAEEAARVADLAIRAYNALAPRERTGDGAAGPR